MLSSLDRTKRLLVIFAALVLMVPLLAACTGDDEDDPTATADVPAATTPDDSDADTTPDMDMTPESDMTPEMDTTPDTDVTPEMDTTPGTDATADVDATPEMDATPDADTTPEMDATPDTASTPDTATTPDTDATPGTGMSDGPFGDLGELSAEVPNYTVEFQGSFVNVPDDLGDLYTTDFEFMLMQSEPDVYQLRISTTGDEEFQVELWALPNATFIAEEGGEPLELPAGVGGEVVPADALMILPDLSILENAEEVGESDVDGRTATEYRVDAEDAVVILLATGQDVNISNPQGEMRVWVDEELGIVTQMTADVTFENADGSEGSMDVEYIVTDIESTDDIEAPTSS